jgi:two-component system phosphate regulon sensor histidine kinase PhoR
MEWLYVLISVVVIACLLFVIWRQRQMLLQLRQQASERAGLAPASAIQNNDALGRELARWQESSEELRSRLQDQESSVRALEEQLNQAREQAQQSRTQFDAIANVAYDALFALDEQGVVTAHNHSAVELFGGRNPDGQHFSAVVNAPELQELIVQAQHENDCLEEQFIIDKRYFRARLRVLRGVPGHQYVGVAMQDITQLVRLNRARRDMVANISHELRTPIANIRMIIEGLFHDQSRPKRKASIASLRAIARETESLQWTVQELLDLSMIESGQAIMKLVEEPLVEIVDDAVLRLKEKLERKNLRVVRHVPSRIRVLCDREHIVRVFINLIGNAIKWSPADDVVTISATGKDEEITVTVFDHGPGVPDDQRERIFERFYQVDTARSGNEGSGLGLAICKHVIEAHGGVIWAEGNSRGGGGRFLFTLIDASSDDVEASYMDRGQHDVLRPYAAPPPVQPNNYEYGMGGLDDDYEIEFVDDGEETTPS